jgi:hypothetical protein
MHRGAEHERDSVIDLAWFNEAAIQIGIFSDLQVDWEGSLGSDHARLQIEGLPQPTAGQPIENSLIGFVVDPELKDEWIKNFKSSPPPLMFPSIPTADEVEQVAAELFETIQTANENTFCRRQPFHPKAAPWWNESCTAATQQMRNTEDKPNRNAAHAQLKRTVCAAKQHWANKYIENAKLWEVATWRHGHKASKVLSLHGPNGLVHAHEDIVDILLERFFAKTPPQVQLRFHDNLP